MYIRDFSFNDLHDMKNEDVIRHSSLYSLKQENNNPVVGSTCFPENVPYVTEIYLRRQW
jgi:hypothetical protein